MVQQQTPPENKQSRDSAVSYSVSQTDLLENENLRSGGRRKNRPQSAWAVLAQLTPRAPGTVQNRIWEDQGLLWCCFAFSAGIAVYRVLPAEPNWILLTALTIFAVGAAYRVSRRGALSRFVLLLLALLCGLAVASVRTAAVEAPKLAEMMNVTLTGFVLERQVNARGTRLLLQVETVDDRPRSDLGFPKKVRVRVPVDDIAKPGQLVELRGRLFPPAGPVLPGGYDFSYRAYFSQIGATGFGYGPSRVLEADTTPRMVQAMALVQNLRERIANKIRTVLGQGPETALVVALLVGDRSGITEAQEEALRAAGLAHILAISGLHMALFAGGAFGAVLLLLSLFQPLALRWPIHKWAAATALCAAVGYLLISGAAVATQRSFVMIGLVFLGVLVGRRGLTLRSVALAGFLLLLVSPERLFFPGFQMSFSAVICLVAVYELWRSRNKGSWKKETHTALLPRVFGSLGKWSFGLLVTAVVAGLATGIVGAHHFGRIAPYGVVGNMLGMPVFSLLVMPMGVLALILMPFGLAALPLAIMSLGISWLLDISEFTAALGGDTGTIGNLSALPTLFLMSALFLVLLLPGRLRLLSAVPCVVAMLLIFQSRPPDVQIASSGSRVAARDDNGQLNLSSTRSSFASELWLQKEGVSNATIKSRKMKSSQRSCDQAGCVINAHAPVLMFVNGQRAETSVSIAFPRQTEALYQDCQFADLIVTDLIVPDDCPAAIVIDAETRSRRGAVSIWLSVQPNAGADTVPRGQKLIAETGRQKNDEVGKFGAQTVTTVISKIRFAIPETPRPWHHPGEMTRAILTSKSK